MEPIKYGGTGQSTTPASPSMAIWNDCPWSSIKSGREPGFCFEDDFITFDGSATAGAAKWYTVQEASGSDIAIVDSLLGGVVRMSTGNTDNDQAIMGSSLDGGSFSIVANSGGKVWYESRILTNAVTSACLAVGMINAADIAADLLADNGVDTDMLGTSEPDFVGFVTTGADGAGLDAIYMDQSSTGGHPIHLADAQTLVADTWYKVGWYFDGKTTLKYYVDNAQVGTNLDITGSDFPDGEELALAFAIKTGTAADKQLDIDWVRAAQLRV